MTLGYNFYGLFYLREIVNIEMHETNCHMFALTQG